MTEKVDLPKLMSETLESWSESMAKLYYNEDYCKKFLDSFKNLPPSPLPKPNAWDDPTPFEECNWFVITQEDCGYSSQIYGFKTRKKAELFMKEYSDVYPYLIKGKIVK